MMNAGLLLTVLKPVNHKQKLQVVKQITNTNWKNIKTIKTNNFKQYVNCVWSTHMHTKVEMY